MRAPLLYDPEYCRKRAEEARALAKELVDPDLRELMIGTAADYEILAIRAESRLARPER